MSEVRVDFTGRTVIVTGAARGIGLSVAKRFQAASGTVVAVDHDADGLNAAAAAIGAIAAPADVSRTDDAAQVVALAVERTGRVDVLVNNAGILRDKVLWKLIDDDWETVLGVHAGGTFRFTRACVPHFGAQNYVRVVNVTSTGLRGNRGQATTPPPRPRSLASP